MPSKLLGSKGDPQILCLSRKAIESRLAPRREDDSVLLGQSISEPGLPRCLIGCKINWCPQILNP